MPDNTSDPEITSQLSGGIRDREYILLMVPHQDWTETLEIYEFVVCKLKQKSKFHPASHYIATSNLPHSPNSHMAAFATKGPTERLIQALIAEGNPYPINYVDALIDEDMVVAPSTCVPAYRGIRGDPMKLVSQNVDQQKINAAAITLSNAKFKASRDSGNHYLGAFGIGAAFSSFGNEELKALRRLIPERFHQISLSWPLGGLRKIPYIGGLFRFNWGNPGMANLGLGMFAVGQNRPFEVFIESGLDMANYKLLSLMPGEEKTKVDVAGEVAALAGTGVGGYVTGRMVISRAASLVAKHAKTTSGQWGTVAAGLVVPLMTTIMINRSTNAGQDALDNFQAIVSTMLPPSSDTGDLSVVLSNEVRSYLPDVVHLLGRTFFHARWGSPLELYSSCIPDDSTAGYTCKPLFPMEGIELGTGTAQEQSSDSPPPTTTRDGDILASEEVVGAAPVPPSSTLPIPPPPLPPEAVVTPSVATHQTPVNCFSIDDPSTFVVDRGLLMWQAYMNCRFYGGGASCSQKYKCSISFADEAECRRRADQLNSARLKKGSGVFSSSQITRNCQMGRWQ